MMKGFAGILEFAEHENPNLLLQETTSHLWNLFDKSSLCINIDNCVSMEDIASISQRPPCKSIPDFFKELTFIFNGITLQLFSCLRFSGNDIVGGNINMINKTTKECCMVFPVERCPYFRVKKILTDDANEFLLVQSGKNSASDNVCKGFWLFGKLDDDVVPFIDIKVLKKVGLIYQDIASSIEHGEIKLLGYTRDRDCRIWSQSRRETIGYQYQGHTAYQIGKGHFGINAIYITWNKMLGKFYIRLEDGLSKRVNKNI